MAQHVICRSLSSGRGGGGGGRQKLPGGGISYAMGGGGGGISYAMGGGGGRHFIRDGGGGGGRHFIRDGGGGAAAPPPPPPKAMLDPGLCSVGHTHACSFLITCHTRKTP